MSQKTFRVDSIDGGISKKYYSKAGDGTYLSALGIDPDLPWDLNTTNSNATRTSGVIMPSVYYTFGAPSYTGAPLWMTAQNKTDNSYIHTSDGKLYSLDKNFTYRSTDEAGTSFPISFTSASGNGFIYYNNFLYFFKDADVSVYGPLDSSVTITKTEGVWSGANKAGSAGHYPGFNQSVALSNYIYPAFRGVTIPNHAAHYHIDNAVYFCDTDPTVANQGIINKIKTKKSTGGSPIEGDTDDGSAYKALALPYGVFPTDIESYGSDLVVAGFRTANSTYSAAVNYGRASLFFWDTTSDSFYNEVDIPDPIITALYNANGQLYIFSGNSQGGFRVSQYMGGKSIQQIAFFEEGNPPFAGAVDAIGERIFFGSYTTYPQASASVFAIGSKTTPQNGVLHNVVRTKSTGGSPIVTAVKSLQQANNIYPRIFAGWHDGSTAGGLDTFANSDQITTTNSLFRTPVFTTGGKFRIENIALHLTKGVDANTTITPKIFVDNESSSYTLSTINSTNYALGTLNIFTKGLKSTGNTTIIGYNNFFLELAFTGSSIVGVQFPIEIEVEIYDDEPAK